MVGKLLNGLVWCSGELDGGKRPQSGCLVSARAEEGELARVPAPRDHLVLVLSHHNTRQRSRQVPCQTQHHVSLTLSTVLRKIEFLGFRVGLILLVS